MAGNSKPKGSITFISYDKPSITDGVYDLSVSQSFSVGTGGINADDTQRKLKIAALGPRFSLEPQLVTGKFPPDKSMGEYFTVLPHLIFKRSILPWERKVSKGAAYADAPWLALLLFTKDENISSQTIPLETLTTPVAERIGRFPTVTLQPGQTRLIDCSLSTCPGDTACEKVLPTKDALPYLAHVRQSADPTVRLHTRSSSVAGCHNPAASARSTLCLWKTARICLTASTRNKTYRLVSLLRGASLPPEHTTFKDLLLAAYQNDTAGSERNIEECVANADTRRSQKDTATAKINGWYRQGLGASPAPDTAGQPTRFVVPRTAASWSSEGNGQL